MLFSERYDFTTNSKIGPILGTLPVDKARRQYLLKVVVLNNNDHHDSVLYNLQKGWTIEFKIGPSLYGKKIALFTNLPASATEKFNRNVYQSLEWKIKNKTRPFSMCLDDNDLCAVLPLFRAGTFHYYFTDHLSQEKLGSGYLLVDPVLSFGSDNAISLSSIKCQTVLSKCLGAFEKWESRLEVSKECGYNMIHFTPIQKLGGSNSSYSVKDQLKLNPAFNSENCTPTFADVFRLMKKMKKDWKIFSMGDVVLNHTANESPWLQNHPECTYNMITAPHLIPAAILDGHLHVFNKEVSQGKLIKHGIPKKIYLEDHVQAIKNYLERNLIHSLRLYEFYTVDADKLVEEFLKKAEGRIPVTDYGREKLVLIYNFIDGRNQAKVDLELSVKIFNIRRNDTTDEESRLKKCAEDFKRRLFELNTAIKNEVDSHLVAAINNCIANIRYFRLQKDGPKVKDVSVESPIVPRYFTGNFNEHEMVETEVLSNGRQIMAHNGWVMNSDPLRDFAELGSNVYLRRELIAWGDCVKLRYGKSYDDCPFLWDHMRKYMEISAELFDGIRLDNCHSTPLHVAEFLVDCARNIKPDLYIAAELFTNSETIDNIFVNKLGITSIIREASNAFNSRELGRYVHRYGGESVGSFCTERKSSMVPGTARALFFDVTHDNPSPIMRNSVFNLIPTASVVSMANCAIGSSRGFDELVPHQIHVVKENRLYPEWTTHEPVNTSYVGAKTGIISIKRIINEIHEQLSEEGFIEIFVDQMNEDIIAITRHNPITHDNVILVAHMAFCQPSCSVYPKPSVRNLKVEGELHEIILETKLISKSKENIFSPPGHFEPDGSFINGLNDYEPVIEENISIGESKSLKLVSSNEQSFSEFELTDFVPGSVVIFRVRPRHTSRQAFKSLKSVTEKFISYEFDSEIVEIVSKLNLKDLNYALYRCSKEDLEDGIEPYNIPGYGHLVYCGLQGLESILESLRLKNNLSHPLCDNLRQGHWLLDHMVSRFKNREETAALGNYFYKIFEHIKSIPKYMIPRYFDIVVSSICSLLKSRAAFQMSGFIRNGSTFVRLLALGSVQCTGSVGSASLPPFSPNVTDDENTKITLCAGLPHFSIGYVRSWGRDTFISLRGFFLLTGRFDEARYHILGYAACLRHGLMPNLLDRGINARYNSRDAVWWWLHSITSYIDLVPNGETILREIISRLYPDDDSPAMGAGASKWKLQDIMQEALNIHFEGLTFRERNAGPEIDVHMTSCGFNNKIGVDLETGFVFGGNQFNCGTWMDKMGCDAKSGNRGKPATSRDGSAIELVALCKAVVRALHHLYERKIYPYSGVERRGEGGKVIRWSFEKWGKKISDNFEKLFWIPEEVSPWETKPELIHRRMIYKDCLGAFEPWSDYQFRPNFLIALTVAPEMVTLENAWVAIKKAEEILLGPLGIKTLDPADWNYNGDYCNDDNSSDWKTAQGFNYHQGPEWLWPVGFFLRAKMHFSKLLGVEELHKTIMEIRSYLGNHYSEILSSSWCGLPELTNKNGNFCLDGCRVQAWSMACMLEALYDLHLIEAEYSS